MAVNRDKPDRWKADVESSVEMYNAWFIDFAPQAFRETRVNVTETVASTLKATDHLRTLDLDVLRQTPPSCQPSGCVPVRPLPEIV